MSLKNKIAPVVAAGAIALGGMLAAPAAHSTGNPNSLDQGDLSLACKLSYGQSGWTAQLYGSTAYSWKCIYLTNTSDKRNVDINNYCQHYWGVWAQTTNPSSPYSWRCQV